MRFNRLPRMPRGANYGWSVAAGGAVLMVLTVGPTQQAASAFFTAIEGEYRWSRAMVTGAASIGQLSSAILGPVQGALIDRVGPRRMILIGLLIGGAGAVGLSQMRNPVTYYIAFLAMSAGVSLGGFMPAAASVNAWLPRRRAAGMAILQLGQSTATVLVPVVALGITTLGWRWTMLGAGVLLLTATPALAWIVGRPADAATSSINPARTSEPRVDGGEFTVREAMRTRAFWAIAIAHALANLSVSVVLAHVILALTGQGLSLQAASTALPIIGTIAIVSQVAAVLVGDRVDKRRLIVVFLAIQAVAVAVLAFATTYWMAAVFALLWGLGYGGRVPLLHALRGDYFGRRSFATILGVNNFIVSIGSVAAPVLVGLVFDVTGTYRVAFLVLACACLASCLAVLAATPPVTPRPRAAASGAV